MFKSNIYSIQNWFPVQELFCDGIIKLKNNNLIKIIKINPINYELKSEFEKQAILNSYKTFLKNCNFDIQIIIQSDKEDISKNIEIIKNREKIEKGLNNNFIVNISKKYINYIKNQNKEKLSSSKKFYILIKSKNSQDNSELKEKYLKIKEALSRCGNSVCEIKTKEELESIFKKYLK